MESMKTQHDTDQSSFHFDPCQNAGCPREATTVWTNNYGIERHFCAECDVEVNLRVILMIEPDTARVRLDEYRTVIEQGLGRGLYDMEPGRLYRGTPGQMQ